MAYREPDLYTQLNKTIDSLKKENQKLKEQKVSERKEKVKTFIKNYSVIGVIVAVVFFALGGLKSHANSHELLVNRSRATAQATALEYARFAWPGATGRIYCGGLQCDNYNTYARTCHFYYPDASRDLHLCCDGNSETGHTNQGCN